jgi:hypothetical protein
MVVPEHSDTSHLPSGQHRHTTHGLIQNDHQYLDHESLAQQSMDHQSLDHTYMDHQSLDQSPLDHEYLDYNIYGDTNSLSAGFHRTGELLLNISRRHHQKQHYVTFGCGDCGFNNSRNKPDNLPGREQDGGSARKQGKDFPKHFVIRESSREDLLYNSGPLYPLADRELSDCTCKTTPANILRLFNSLLDATHDDDDSDDDHDDDGIRSRCIYHNADSDDDAIS